MSRYGPEDVLFLFKLGLAGNICHRVIAAGSTIKIAGSSAAPANYIINNTNGQSLFSCANSYLSLAG